MTSTPLNGWSVAQTRARLKARLHKQNHRRVALSDWLLVREGALRLCSREFIRQAYPELRLR